MSYHPQGPRAPRDHPHYPPQEQPPYRDHGGERHRERADSESVASVVRVLIGAIVAIFVLHVLFVVFDANQGNGFVTFVYGAAKVFVLGLGDVFTPDDALLGLVLNYGLAALVYLVIGQLVIKALRR